MTETATVDTQPKAPQQKVRVGVVVSAHCDKTAIVEIDRLVQHPKYRKFIHRRKKYYAHDEQNTCRVGDKVKIIETRPLSKLKRWRLLEILERGETE